MNVLRFAGVDSAKARDASILAGIRNLVDTATAAHDKLRANLRTDPHFAAVVCRALGCERDGCAEPPKAVDLLEKRSVQVPKVVEKITSAG